MKQREFPWIQAVSPPQDAPRAALAQCTSYGMAARVSLAAKPGGRWSDAWLATRLGVSKGYLSRVLNDKQEMPAWMIRPICYATGSNLVRQYADLQDALAVTDSRRDVERLAELVRRANPVERRQCARTAA